MGQQFKKRQIILTLIPVLLIMGLIFFFSQQSGDDSSATSGKIVSVVLNLFVPDYDGLPAEQQAQIMEKVSFIVRKLAHFSEFAALGFFLMLHIHTLGKSRNVKLPWLWSWGIGTLYALSDEFHQQFIGGRAPSLRDVGIDSSGVISGTLIMLLLLFLIQKIKRHKRNSLQ